MEQNEDCDEPAETTVRDISGFVRIETKISE